MNVVLCSVAAGVRCAFCVLGLSLLLANSVEAQPINNSRLLTSWLERLAVSKAEYAKAQKPATDGVTKQFDEVIAASVEGTYDGVILNFKMLRMKRGAPRYFAYSGQLVGLLARIHFGGIKVGGIKVGGVKTTGVLTLQRKQGPPLITLDTGSPEPAHIPLE